MSVRFGALVPAAPTTRPAAAPSTAADSAREPNGFFILRASPMPLTKAEREALAPYDPADALLLGIRPLMRDVYRPCAVISEDSGPFRRDELGHLYSIDPRYRVVKEPALGGEGLVETPQVCVGKKLDITDDERRRLEELKRIPRDLTWNDLLTRYGREFEQLAPAVQEKVKENPRLAVAGLLGLTTPAATPEVDVGLPKVAVGGQPEDLGPSLMQVRRNPANGSYLSLGCEGGYVGAGAEHRLAYMGWDEKHGLVAPKAAYIPIVDDDRTFALVATAAIGFVTAGVGMGPIAAGALTGAVQAGITGGDLLKGAVLGGLGGGLKLVTPGLSEALGGGLAGQAAAQALTGGAASVLAGGSFGQGALSGAVGVFATNLQQSLLTQLTAPGVGVPLPVAQVASQAIASGLRAAALGDDIWAGAALGGAQALGAQLQRLVSNALGNSVPANVLGAALNSALVAAAPGHDARAALEALGSALLQLRDEQPKPPPAPKLEPGQVALWDAEGGKWIVTEGRSIDGTPLVHWDVAATATASWSGVGPGPIAAASLRQGEEGNCYVLAALDEVARKLPGLLESNMYFTPDGEQVTVKLYDIEGKPLYVTVDTMLYDVNGKLLYGSPEQGATESGLRMLLVEKALALAMPQLTAPEKTTQGNYGGLIQGGYSALILSFLTGSPLDMVRLDDLNGAEVRAKLKEYAESGLPVVAATKDSDNPDAISLKYGVLPNHAYSIIGVFKDESGKDFVRLRNPWGWGEPGSKGPNVRTSKDGVDDGIFSMPMADFRIVFHDVGTLQIKP